MKFIFDASVVRELGLVAEFLGSLDIKATTRQSKETDTSIPPATNILNKVDTPDDFQKTSYCQLLSNELIEKHQVRG